MWTHDNSDKAATMKEQKTIMVEKFVWKIAKQSLPKTVLASSKLTVSKADMFDALGCTIMCTCNCVSKCIMHQRMILVMWHHYTSLYITHPQKCKQQFKLSIAGNKNF